MEEPLFIDDSQIQKQALDYDYLRAEGIRLIQQLAGDSWTDFNEHDPGVTILEQFCYALTELAYRTDFDIQDLLFDDSREAESRVLFQANQLFPCNPLTVSDYRKLLLDSIFEIKNVWLFPLGHESTSLNGLYWIALELQEEIKDEDSKKVILEKARDVFCAHRNIAEDIDQVTVLEPVDVSINAAIEIDGKESLEAMMANILLRVDQHLSPEIKIYSLEELLEEGLDRNEIFEGPYLKHGFIKANELLPKASKILIPEITKIIMDVPGVAKVKDLSLRVGQRVFKNQVDVGEGKLPRLVTDIPAGGSELPIRFSRGSVQYRSIDASRVKRILSELQAATSRVFRLNEDRIEAPKGKKLELKEYYSVQNQFPANYGIGESGVPDNPDAQRRAQAKQLKGFLLLFEQILVNFLAQLAHTKDLFSIDRTLRQTYFHQYLNGVPHLEDLLKNRAYGFVSSKSPGDTLSYESGLPDLVKAGDNFADRRNRFLDYLLAIHGEEFNPYYLSQFNYYFDEEGFNLYIIRNKIKLLKHLATINRNRSQAFDYRKGPEHDSNVSGLENKISILLGLGVGSQDDVDDNGYQGYPSTLSYLSRGFSLLDEKATPEKIESWRQAGDISYLSLDGRYLDNNFDHLDPNDIRPEDFTEDQKTALLERTIPFFTKTILADFLRNGIDIDNYRIGTHGTNPNVIVLYRPPGVTDWLQVGVFENKREATQAVIGLIELLKQINIQSEGLFLIEHILLRPEASEKRFGFFLLDREGNKVLKSTVLKSFQERQEIIEALRPFIGKSFNITKETIDKLGDDVPEAILKKLQTLENQEVRGEETFLNLLYETVTEDQIIKYKSLILKHARTETYKNYSVERRTDGDFEVFFKTPDDRINLVSLMAYESVQEIYGRMEDLYNFLSDIDDFVPYEEKIGLFIQHPDLDFQIAEDVFSFRISLVFPDWTSRFNNPEFRSVVEETVEQHRPANVSSSCYWLNPQEMEQFERVYHEWRLEKVKDKEDQSGMDLLNMRLMAHLLKFKLRGQLP